MSESCLCNKLLDTKRKRIYTIESLLERKFSWTIKLSKLYDDVYNIGYYALQFHWW